MPQVRNPIELRRLSAFVAAGMIIGCVLPAACRKKPQEKAPAPDEQPVVPAAAAPAPTPPAPPPPPPPPPTGRAAICEKLKPAAAEVIGVATTISRPVDQAGLPLRCVYDPDSTKGPWFELHPGGKPENARKNLKTNGGKITDLPELGSGVFSAVWGLQNWVIGAKGDTLIRVTGNYDFPKLQAFWKKVAAEL